MKKLKLMALICIGIIGFFIFNLTIHANQEFVVKINSIEDTIEFKNQGIQTSKKTLRTFKLVTEEDEILAYHLLPQEEEYGLILYKGYIEDLYTLEGFVLNPEIKTCLQEISKEEFEYLIEGAEPILDSSEFGEKLKRSQERFEVNHAYIVNKPADSGIETYGLERHNRSVEKMTSTDEYIDGYTPTYENTSPYIRTYTDNIINIVPEEWLFEEGSYAYVGKEYAIAVSTKDASSPAYGSYCTLARVAVFDIDIALPYLYVMDGSDTPATNGYTRMSNLLNIKIKPVINCSYYGYEKKNFSSDYWNRNFDIGETRTVVARRESTSTIYIEPVSLGVIIDDSKSNLPNTVKFSCLSYNLSASNQMDFLLEQMKLQKAAFSSFVELASLLITLGISKDPLSTTLAKGVTRILSLATNNALKVYNGMSESSRKAELNGNLDNLEEGIKKVLFFCNYEETYNSEKISSFIFNHSNISSIFQNEVLKNYSHNYDLKFTYNVGGFSEFYYDVYISGLFNFYDNYNFKINNVESNQLYNNLNLKIETDYEGSYAKDINIYNGSSINTNLSLSKLTATILVKATYTGLTELRFDSSRYVIADIYDEDGNKIQTNSLTYSKNQSLLFRAVSGKRYFIFLRFSYNTSGNITLAFKKISESYTSVSSYTSYKMSSIGESMNVQYLMLNLVGGQYSFSTRTEYDTSIRVFDENLNLLGESYDPNADWNEEEPDLNAYCYINTTSPKKVIVEIRMNASPEYYVYVNYFSTTS